MELSIIKSLEEKVLKYKEEIQQIETAIEVIRKNTASKSTEFKTETITRKRKSKPEAESNISTMVAPRAKKGNSTKVLKETGKRPVSKQVLDYLEETNRFLFPSEISGELSLRSGKKLPSVKLLVNQTLSRLKKENKLISYKPEKSRSHAWGFSNWLDSDRLPDSAHLPSAAE